MARLTRDGLFLAALAREALALKGENERLAGALRQAQFTAASAEARVGALEAQAAAGARAAAASAAAAGEFLRQRDALLPPPLQADEHAAAGHDAWDGSSSGGGGVPAPARGHSTGARTAEPPSWLPRGGDGAAAAAVSPAIAPNSSAPGSSGSGSGGGSGSSGGGGFMSPHLLFGTPANTRGIHSSASAPGRGATQQQPLAGVSHSTPVQQHQQQQQQPPQAAAATPAAGLHAAHSTAVGSGAVRAEGEGLGEASESGGGDGAEGEDEEEGAEDDAPLLQPVLRVEHAARGFEAGPWAEHEGGGEGAGGAPQAVATGAGTDEPAAGVERQHLWVQHDDETSML